MSVAEFAQLTVKLYALLSIPLNQLIELFESRISYVNIFLKDTHLKKGGSHYAKLTALKTGGVALCPKYCPILMKIGEQVGFYVYYSYNWGPRNFDKN